MSYIILANSNKRPRCKLITEDDFDELPVNSEIVIYRDGSYYLGHKTPFGGIRLNLLYSTGLRPTDKLYKIVKYTEVFVRCKSCGRRKKGRYICQCEDQ